MAAKGKLAILADLVAGVCAITGDTLKAEPVI